MSVQLRFASRRCGWRVFCIQRPWNAPKWRARGEQCACSVLHSGVVLFSPYYAFLRLCSKAASLIVNTLGAINAYVVREIIGLLQTWCVLIWFVALVRSFFWTWHSAKRSAHKGNWATKAKFKEQAGWCWGAEWGWVPVSAGAACRAAPCARRQRCLLNVSGVLGRSGFCMVLEAVCGLFPPSPLL